MSSYQLDSPFYLCQQFTVQCGACSRALLCVVDALRAPLATSEDGLLISPHVACWVVLAGLNERVGGSELATIDGMAVQALREGWGAVVSLSRL